MSKQTLAIAVTALLAACGGGGSGTPGGSSPVTTPTTSLNGLGGIWRGTAYPAAGGSYAIEGIVAKDGRAKFWQPVSSASLQGTELAPDTLTPANDSISFSSSYIGYTTHGVSFPDGSHKESGTLSGSVNASAGSISGRYSSDSGDDTSFTLKYDRTYQLKSSLVTVKGDYSFQFMAADGSTPNGTLSIDSTGSISGPADDAGCTYSGRIGLISKTYNAYSVSLSRGCAGGTTALSGLASFFPATLSKTAYLKMIVDDGASVGVEIVASQ